MTCLSEERAMLYADGEMEQTDAEGVEVHVASCAACADLVAWLREENAALRQSLDGVTELAPAVALGSAAAMAPAPRVAIEMPQRRRALAFLAGSVAASLALALPVQLPVQWMTERFTEGADVMSKLGWSLGGVVSGVSFEVAFRLMQRLVAVVAVCAVLLPQAGAMDRRTGQAITVGADEVIDETLLAAGESIVVDGTVNGDVLAFGRSVEIRGTVTGMVFTWGQTVQVSGRVDGSLVGGAQTVTISGQVLGNVYAGAQTVQIGPQGEVGRELFAGGQTIRVEGLVGRGVAIGGAGGIVSGNVGGDVLFGGETLSILRGAEITGSVRSRVPATENVRIEDGATVLGAVDTRVQRRESRNRFLSVGFYVGQVLRLLSAFVVGLVLAYLFPAFFAGAVAKVGDVGRSAGVGFLVLVAAPVAILIAAITVVGLPVAGFALALYMAGLYLAKIVVGAFIGTQLLGGSQGARRMAGEVSAAPSWLAILAGLLILLVLFLLPFGAGWLIHFVVWVFGFGALSWELWTRVRGVRVGPPPANA